MTTVFEWIQGRRDIPEADLVGIVEAIRAAAFP